MRCEKWSILLLACAVAAPDATGQNTAELSSQDEPVTFKAKVNLVTVPVVVRDSQGRVVGNLSRDDFQVFDKGRPQVISRFSVERRGGLPVSDAAAGASVAPTSQPATEAAEIPQEYLAYLFDDVHLSFADLVRVRDAADRNVLATTGPDMRIAIFTTSGQGNLDFTDDRQALH